jgi:hypothetical protein
VGVLAAEIDDGDPVMMAVVFEVVVHETVPSRWGPTWGRTAFRPPRDGP